jgi:hypothetical protein
MSPTLRSPGPPPRLVRTLRVWLGVGIALLVALVLVRAPSLAPVTLDEHATPIAGDTGLAMAHGEALDDDNGDEAVDPSHADVLLHDGGAPLANRPRRADAVGDDPPRVPPPEA